MRISTPPRFIVIYTGIKGLYPIGYNTERNITSPPFLPCTHFRAMEPSPVLKQQFGLSIVRSNTATLEAILSVEKRIRPGHPELAKR